MANPIQHGVKPCAWRWPVKKLRGCEWRYSLHQTRPEAEPLYSQAALDEAVAATAVPELLAALQEVIRISDRKHEAWDKAKAVMAKLTANAAANETK